MTTKKIVIGIICIGRSFLALIPISASDERHSCGPAEAQLDPPVWAQAMMQNIEDWWIPEAFRLEKITELHVFTQNDLAIVYTLLKRACCDDGILTEETCVWATQWPNYQAQSPYITDHLMMVGMTKLDGDTEVCETIGLESCDMADAKLDVHPVERREKIREIAKSTDGYGSQQILELFELYRWDAWIFDPKNGEEWFLPKAYIRLCSEVTMIGTMAWLSSSELEVYGDCITSIQNRIAQEAQYTQALMVEKWAQFVWNMMRDYMQKYFTDQRLSGLVTKYWVLDACRRMVLRTVQLTDDCCN